MNFYKIKLAYNGARYQGWQSQPNGLTIQDHLNKALSLVAASEQVQTIGSGRTDAGVHALGQIVRASIPLMIDPYSLCKALNTKLPVDIRAIEAENSSEDFHPIFSAQSKWYSYFFSQSDYPDPFLSDLLSFCSFDLDLNKIELACKIFEGEYDFVNFQTEGTPVKTTVRKIFACHFVCHQPLSTPFPCYGPVYEVKFHGEGFLKQMVRLMVGAIWAVGRGKVSLEDLRLSLAGKSKDRLAAVAPPQGLYLMQVIYP
jgi:tRNA pseudouridine38-40 synthase